MMLLMLAYGAGGGVRSRVRHGRRGPARSGHAGPGRQALIMKHYYFYYSIAEQNMSCETYLSLLT